MRQSRTKCVKYYGQQFLLYYTYSLGEDGHLDAVVGSLLPEGEHLLLGVVQEGGRALPAAVVEVRDDADLETDALYISTLFMDTANITSTSYSPGSVKLYSKVPWEKQSVIIRHQKLLYNTHMEMNTWTGMFMIFVYIL